MTTPAIENDPVLAIAEQMRADRIATILRPYVDKHHAGYIRSLELEMSQRVMCAVGSDKRFMRKLIALTERRDFAAMLGMIVKYERRALKRIGREVVRTKLEAESETGITRILRVANDGIASLVSGKVG